MVPIELAVNSGDEEQPLTVEDSHRPLVRTRRSVVAGSVVFAVAACMLVLGAQHQMGAGTLASRKELPRNAFYKKLHRAAHIISLASESVGAVLKDVGDAEKNEETGDQFESAEKAEESGDEVAPKGPLKPVAELGMSADELAFTNEMFNSIDADENGQVTISELKEVMKSQVPEDMPEEVLDEEVTQAFKMAGPGREKPIDSVSFKEFANFLVEETGDDVDAPGQMADDILDEMDGERGDNDGKLDKDELVDFFEELMPEGALPNGKTYQDFADVVFQMFDYDGDDHLDRDEIIEMLKATQ